MRIIGTIDHPVMRISVFKSDNRISVKFETELYEQTFKLGEDERYASLEAVEKWVDADMMEAVLAGFRHLHATRLAVDKRKFSATDQEFEEII